MSWGVLRKDRPFLPLHTPASAERKFGRVSKAASGRDLISGSLARVTVVSEPEGQ